MNTGLKTITHIAKISVNTHNSVVTLKHKTQFGNIYTSSCYQCFSKNLGLDTLKITSVVLLLLYIIPKFERFYHDAKRNIF